jgi:hypothetical protein
VIHRLAQATPENLLALGVSHVVLLIEGVLSPFKIEDWKSRAIAAERAAAVARIKEARANIRAIELEAAIIKYFVEMERIIQQAMS